MATCPVACIKMAESALVRLDLLATAALRDGDLGDDLDERGDRFHQLHQEITARIAGNRSGVTLVTWADMRFYMAGQLRELLAKLEAGEC